MKDSGKEKKGDRSKIIKIVTLKKFAIIMQPRVMGIFSLTKLLLPFERTSWEIGNHIILFLTCVSRTLMATHCTSILSGLVTLHILSNFCRKKALLGTLLRTYPLSFPETEFSNAKSLKLLWFILFSPHPLSNFLTVSCL